MVGKPNPIDIHVGNQLRVRRTLRGLSQTELAAAVGLTFQQVQKYEQGTNRISASRLYRLANVLRVSVLYFFEGIPTEPSQGHGRGQTISPPSDDGLMTSRETLQLVRYYYRIQNETARELVYDLVQELGKEV